MDLQSSGNTLPFATSPESRDGSRDPGSKRRRSREGILLLLLFFFFFLVSSRGGSASEIDWRVIQISSPPSLRFQTNHIRHGSSDKCLAITESKQQLVMEECSANAARQRWSFENYDPSKL